MVFEKDMKMKEKLFQAQTANGLYVVKQREQFPRFFKVAEIIEGTKRTELKKDEIIYLSERKQNEIQQI